jgi:MFS family permease
MPMPEPNILECTEKDAMEGKPGLDEPVSWAAMPNKDQLFLIALSRLADFYQLFSFRTIMFYQLQSLALAHQQQQQQRIPGLTAYSDSPETMVTVISRQTGLIQSAYSVAQAVTAAPWGWLADRPWCGRKAVLIIGLTGMGIACLGTGFATTAPEVVLWQVFGGAVNGTIGAARTLVAESVPQRFQARAFVLLPLAMNVATALGPSECLLAISTSMTTMSNHQRLRLQSSVVYYPAIPRLQLNSRRPLRRCLASFHSLHHMP